MQPKKKSIFKRLWCSSVTIWPAYLKEDNVFTSLLVIIKESEENFSEQSIAMLNETNRL